MILCAAFWLCSACVRFFSGLPLHFLLQFLQFCYWWSHTFPFIYILLVFTFSFSRKEVLFWFMCQRARASECASEWVLLPTSSPLRHCSAWGWCREQGCDSGLPVAGSQPGAWALSQSVWSGSALAGRGDQELQPGSEPRESNARDELLSSLPGLSFSELTYLHIPRLSWYLSPSQGCVDTGCLSPYSPVFVKENRFNELVGTVPGM